MFRKFVQLSLLSLTAGLSVAQQLQPAPNPGSLASETMIHVGPWTSQKAQHAYGLPDIKPKANGTIVIDKASLTFITKASRYTIPWAQTTLVSNGTERVELWGTTGRIVRMAIPNGGGLAAAGVMQHKVNELTVDFRDARGAYHGAVFYVSAADSAHVLDLYSHIIQPGQPSSTPEQNSAPPTTRCNSAPRSVLVLAPSWNQTDVPAAYRAMVYEHIVNRLQHVEGTGHVYRYGESESSFGCPQYTVAVSIVSFKPGNQVQRAMSGPIGFFAGTTQMVFNISIRDVSGQLNTTEQVKATVRGEGESKNVTDGVAKKIAKSYAAKTKQFEKTSGSEDERSSAALTQLLDRQVDPHSPRVNAEAHHRGIYAQCPA
jgi:hypothetical protein